MKITDDELLHAIWLNQLKNLSDGVLCNYIGGKIGLWLNFEFASDCHNRHMGDITDRLSRQQLRKRVKKLADDGRIVSPYGKRLLTFYIDGPSARAAYEAANQWWRERGVPEGEGEHPDGRTYAKTVKIDNLGALKAECAQYLLDNWSNAL